MSVLEKDNKLYKHDTLSQLLNDLNQQKKLMEAEQMIGLSGYQEQPFFAQ